MEDPEGEAEEVEDQDSVEVELHPRRRIPSIPSSRQLQRVGDSGPVSTSLELCRLGLSDV